MLTCGKADISFAISAFSFLELNFYFSRFVFIRLTKREFDDYLFYLYDCSVMVASLPEFVDPLAFAEKNIRIKGELPVIKFTRIYELLYDYDGCVDFHLIFYKESNIVNIEGHITGSLTLKCQRCLEPLMWSIDSDFKLGVVNSFEGVNKLPEDFEPLMLQGQEKIALKDIIEDELLLVAPSVPKHLNNCLAENALGHDTGFSRGKANPEKNPFSILADFKNLENFNGSTKK